MIQIFSNSLGKEELAAVERVFNSKWLGFAAESKLFEKEFAQKIACPRVLCVNSCTAALFMSMKILDIGINDEVIIPTVNFIGTANAVAESGARPVFADVDKETLNIIPSEISRLRGKKTKAVLLLHYGGHPCDMDEIYKHTDGLYIIEDSANSILSKYKGKNCGTLGDIGCFSFDAMKILSMGDGGAITIMDEKRYEKSLEARYLGIKNRQSGIDALKERKERWWEIDLGSISNRYLTNDILSAIARVQLRKLDGFIRRRKEIWDIYQKEFASLEWLAIPPEPLNGCESSYYLYWIRLEEGCYRDALAAYLIKNKIYCTFRYFPLHLIQQYGSQESLKNAELINDTVLNIPLHQNLSDSEVGKVIEVLKSFAPQRMVTKC